MNSSSDSHVDLLIIGQGLAGTAFAWTALGRGLSIRIIDRCEAVTASRIAAGLLMPITGKRLAKSWRWDDFWPVAKDFYREIEQRTGQSFFTIGPTIRLLQTDNDLQQFELRMSQKEYSGLIEPFRNDDLPHGVHEPRAVARFPISGRLNVPAYLNASKTEFIKRDLLIEADLNIEANLEVASDRVTLPSLQLTANRAVLCRGFAGHTDPQVDGVCWNPAKGEIATIESSHLALDCVLQFGNWLVPIGSNQFRLGSTFNWSAYDTRTTAEGRNELELRLKSVLTVPYEFVDQQAAVRPTICDFRPVIGWHPDQPRIGVLNGLGTKGSLMAPWLASRLLDAIDGAPIDPEIYFRRW